MRRKSNRKRNVYAVSACLLGVPCRWDGTSAKNKRALALVQKGRKIIAICPEVLAGLPTPRPACEIVGGDGTDVLRGTARVVDRRGRNYTAKFIRGAKRGIAVAKRAGATAVMLKSGSPSCGARTIYDGTFSGHRKRGRGVFAALFKNRGIRIVSV
ncbi:MAG: DUF523 domain-containing protein [Candidatus Kerfeldbacteria bacterium]